jgi:serine/alanine adding enzyme
LRRALRAEEIIIEEVERHEQVRICYDLLKKTYHFAKVPIADISLFNAAFKTLHPRNMIKFSLARLKDSYVACSVDLLYKSTIYGWYGGTDRAFSRHIPGELLLWYLFEWGAKNGYKVYDFGGAGTPDEEYGVRDFKAKFGGKLVCFGRNTYVHSPLFRLSQRAYAAYRKFFYKQRSR